MPSRPTGHSAIFGPRKRLPGPIRGLCPVGRDNPGVHKGVRGAEARAPASPQYTGGGGRAAQPSAWVWCRRAAAWAGSPLLSSRRLARWGWMVAHARTGLRLAGDTPWLALAVGVGCACRSASPDRGGGSGCQRWHRVLRGGCRRRRLWRCSVRSSGRRPRWARRSCVASRSTRGSCVAAGHWLRWAAHATAGVARCRRAAARARRSCVASRSARLLRRR